MHTKIFGGRAGRVCPIFWRVVFYCCEATQTQTARKAVAAFVIPHIAPQVKSFYRQAHGGRHRGKMVWQDMNAFYEQMEASGTLGVENMCLRETKCNEHSALPLLIVYHRSYPGALESSGIPNAAC